MVFSTVVVVVVGDTRRSSSGTSISSSASTLSETQGVALEAGGLVGEQKFDQSSYRTGDDPEV